MKLKVGHFYRTSKEPTIPGGLSRAHDHSIAVFYLLQKTKRKISCYIKWGFYVVQKLYRGL